MTETMRVIIGEGGGGMRRGKGYNYSSGGMVVEFFCKKICEIEGRD